MELGTEKDEKENEEYISNTFDFPFGMNVLRRCVFILNHFRIYMYFQCFINFFSIFLQMEMDLLCTIFTDLQTWNLFV